MISDWSGAAFDFALGLARPVLFIDVPRKVNNPNYQSVAIEPIEVFARAQMGSVLAVDQLHTLPECLSDMTNSPACRPPALRALRQRWDTTPGALPRWRLIGSRARWWLAAEASTLGSMARSRDRPKGMICSAS